MNRFQISAALLAGGTLLALGLVWQSLRVLEEERRALISVVLPVQLDDDAPPEIIKVYAPAKQEQVSLLEAVDPDDDRVLWSVLSDPITGHALDGYPHAESADLVFLAWAPQIHLDRRILHTQARDKRSGELVWAAEIPGRFDAKPQLFLCDDLVIRASRSRDKSTLFLTSYEAATGEQRWDLSLPRGVAAPRCGSGGILLSKIGGTWIWPDSGEVLPLSAHGAGGVLGGEVHFVTSADGVYEVVRVGPQGPEPVGAEVPRDLSPDLQLGWLQNGLVLLSQDRASLGLVGFNGRESWRLAVGGSYENSGTEWMWKLMNPEPLSRVSFFAFHHGPELAETQVVAVDTLDGTLRWQSRLLPAAITARYLMPHEGGWLFPLALDAEFGGAWLWFDGESGALKSGFTVWQDGRPIPPKEIFPNIVQLAGSRAHLHLDGMAFVVDLNTATVVWNEAPERIKVTRFAREEVEAALGELPVDLAPNGAE